MFSCPHRFGCFFICAFKSYSGIKILAMKDFIELLCIIYSQKEKREKDVEPDECTLIEIVKKVNPDRIESYEEAVPTSDFRDDNKIWTQVTTEGGDSFIVNMPLVDFEKKIFKTDKKVFPDGSYSIPYSPGEKEALDFMQSQNDYHFNCATGYNFEYNGFPCVGM